MMLEDLETKHNELAETDPEAAERLAHAHDAFLEDEDGAILDGFFEQTIAAREARNFYNASPIVEV